MSFWSLIVCVLLCSRSLLPSFDFELSRGCEGCLSSERCRTVELIIALKDLSPCSTGKGADLAALSCEIDCACGCVFSPSPNLFVGDGSRGECSSRIDLDRDKILKGFGLLFFATAVLVDGGCDSPFESRDTSEFDGPPTALLATDRSRLDSVCKVVISIALFSPIPSL